ncbi:hypothetical protein HETIRDRAFT_327283 [Heterobasidion irregulare TC 32-1]|uniref:Uncharacterized protein n=1 Tax=Heterobasidion irregulare (strain TC 32-1) TaxID=747525 RepID=W4JWT4_HETIT|nr:uncharacterized protein HETIRDRAFT_327283 [Heterobasidion irregulare TC 32-1]ETW77550.1 hypothetical protein HETIRDRAFT_327283 [Heterobasidion irregulare TC 32-1]
MRFHDFPGGLDELSSDEKMYVDILLGDEIYINIDKKYDDLVELIRGFNRFLSLNSPFSSSIECSDDCGGLFGRLFNFLNGLTLEEFCELYVTWDIKKQNCALVVIQYKLMHAVFNSSWTIRKCLELLSTRRFNDDDRDADKILLGPFHRELLQETNQITY